MTQKQSIPAVHVACKIYNGQPDDFVLRIEQRTRIT